MPHLSETQLLRFVAQIVSLLIVSRMLAEVMKRFDQAPVIGQLLAGIILGKSVLGHIFPAGYELLFARSRGSARFSFCSTGSRC